MLKLYLALIALGFVSQINCENVPALVWTPNSLPFLPTLKHLSGDEFVTFVKSQADKDTLTVVFVENNLSVEDFSQCKLKTKTCFENLRNIKEKTYLSSVEHPVDSLIAAYDKTKRVMVSSENDLKEAYVDDEKMIIIYFDDVKSQEDFSNHDDLISKLLNQLEKEYKKKVVGVYTGISPSFKYSEVLKRNVRDAEAAEAKVEEKPVEEPKQAATQAPVQLPEPLDNHEAGKVNQTVLADKHAIIALSAFVTTTKNNEGPDTVVEVDVTKLTLKVDFNETKSHEMIVTLSDATHKLEMVTTISGGSWEVIFFYNGNKEGAERYHARTGVYAPGQRFSFGCGELVIQEARGRFFITIHNFQFQPTFELPAEEETVRRFSDNVSDCVGFFSPGIWGALFVIILFIFILAYGLTMMLDIRTMDRFDDPKGKTITINAQE